MSIFGIVCALDWEADCLPSGHSAVRAITSGMGASSAAAAARQLIASGARALVSFGSAGGLDPARRSGDILLPALVCTAAGQEIGCDVNFREALAARLAESRIAVCADALIQVDAALGTPAEKARLFDSQGGQNAAAVDMESWAVAEVAQAAGLPFVAVRAVLDEAGQGLPDDLLSAVDQRGRPVSSSFVLALLGRPALIADLWRLAAARRRAAASLRVAGQALVGLLANPG